ncbi:hypothetical protein AAHC03_013630 [Spirometra sp. Aus1]
MKLPSTSARTAHLLLFSPPHLRLFFPLFSSLPPPSDVWLSNHYRQQRRLYQHLMRALFNLVRWWTAPPAFPIHRHGTPLGRRLAPSGNFVED